MMSNLWAGKNCTLLQALVRGLVVRLANVRNVRLDFPMTRPEIGLQ